MADSSNDDDSDNDESSSNQMIELTQRSGVDDPVRLERMLSEYAASFNDQFNHMSVKQRTSYFVSFINITSDRSSTLC